MQSESVVRVLVAEDNLVNQKVIKGMLARLKLEVDVVGDGQAAVNAVSAQQYAVVIMDCQMPVMDGYEATAEIRRLAGENKITDLPIIALTANAMIGDREKCLDAGMDDFLPKPVTLETLEPVVRKWLDSDYSARKKRVG
ncbi:MAG: response regulator [Gammaproteobacteria bacterium]|nr:response regulator [Gammaproteobacteria bacterium]